MSFSVTNVVQDGKTPLDLAVEEEHTDLSFTFRVSFWKFVTFDRCLTQSRFALETRSACTSTYHHSYQPGPTYSTSDTD